MSTIYPADEVTLQQIAEAVEQKPIERGRFTCGYARGWWTCRIAFHTASGMPKVVVGLDKVMSAAILEAVRQLPEVDHG